MGSSDRTVRGDRRAGTRARVRTPRAASASSPMPRFARPRPSWYDDVTDEDRELADLETSDLLALGLATEPLDLLEAEQEADAEGTYGWYDDEREEMVVRGTNVGDVDVRVTIVHELVHTLQDQHFDLEMLQSRVRTGGEQFALDAIVEGDASRVELEYLWSLSQKEQDAYWAAYEAVDTSAAGRGGRRRELPARARPVLGRRLRPRARRPRRRGREPGAGCDRPALALAAPVRGIDHRSRCSRRARLPGAGEAAAFGVGEAPKGPADDWGAFSWYLLLASRIPWHDALDAADGWGGDRYRSFVRTTGAGDAGLCAPRRHRRHPRYRPARRRRSSAWVTAMPPGVGQSTRHDERVVLSACATGAAPTPSRRRSAGRVRPAVRNAPTQIGAVRRARLVRCTRHARRVPTAIVADDVAHPLLYADRDLSSPRPTARQAVTTSGPLEVRLDRAVVAQCRRG